MTGHDHEGCDVWHYVPSESVWSTTTQNADENDRKTQWDASRWKHVNDTTTSHTGIREVTLRSMMGDYGGNAGLLSAWFDHETGEWDYDICTCGLNLKLWWAVHVLDLVVVALSVLSLVRHMFFTSTKVHQNQAQVAKDRQCSSSKPQK
jgi:hypothetical protein